MTLRSMWVLTGSNSRHNHVAYFGRSNTATPTDSATATALATDIPRAIAKSGGGCFGAAAEAGGGGGRRQRQWWQGVGVSYLPGGTVGYPAQPGFTWRNLPGLPSPTRINLEEPSGCPAQSGLIRFSVHDSVRL